MVYFRCCFNKVLNSNSSKNKQPILKEDGAIPWDFVEEHVGLPLRESQYCIALLPAVTGSHQLTMEFYIGGQMRGYIYNGPFFYTLD